MQTLDNLVSGQYALVNLSKLSQLQPNLIDLILDIFAKVTVEIQERASRLLIIAGRHSISVSQLKRIFRLMKVSGDTRPMYISLLLKALLGMIPDLPEFGPKHFFFLEGENSGLELPSLARWPKTKGFSFSLWFCCNNLKYQSGKTVDKKIYKPTLLSMRQCDGLGIEVYLNPQETSSPNEIKYNLTVISSTSKDQANSIEIPFSIPIVDTWHHLAISQSPGLFRSKCDTIVLLDGIATKEQQPYSKFTDSITRITIGYRELNEREEDSFNTSFCGQIGTITFFAEAFNENQLRSIYKLGPADLGFFNDRLYTKQDGDSSNRSLDGFAAISQAIMLAYNPGDCNNLGDSNIHGSYCLDNTPEKNAIKWKSEVLPINGNKPNSDAFCRTGTYKCTTRDVRDSLDCLGGMEVLLPLFTLCQLKLSSEYELEYDPCFELTMKLLFATVRDTGENRFFIDNSGFTLIAHFLERVDTKFLNLDVIEKLFTDTNNLSWNLKWQDSVLRDIISDFKIWFLADYSVQERILSYLVDFALKNDKRVVNIFTTQKLIDALNMYTMKTVDHIFESMKLARKESCSSTCSDEPKVSDDNELNLNQSLNVSLNQSFDDQYVKLEVSDISLFVTASSYRLNIIQVNSLRTSLLMIFYIQIINNKVVEGIQSLVQYMINDDDSYHRIECLSLLLHVLSPENNHLEAEILSAFTSRQNFMLIVSLFNDSDIKVRLYVLILVTSILHLIINRGNKPISSSNFGNIYILILIY
jgi:hypothetical protein